VATLLYLESSPRKDRSHSIKVAEAFLAGYRKAHPTDHIDRVDLWREALPRFDGDMLNAKYAIIHGENPTAAERDAWGEVERLCNRFTGADKYLISVPMWNFGLPYVLKHYIDVITQPGLAWRFDPATGTYSGLVQGKAAVIYSSGGAYHAGSGAEAYDLQRPSLENWLAFIGITDVARITVAGTLFGPDAAAKAVADASAEATRIAATF
jgi:FMN-dependent NADH-azoreductase